MFLFDALGLRSQVEVYVDGNTQKLNTEPLAPGGTLRFYGLVFNDNGSLRMDCAQISDGVAFSSPSSASIHSGSAASQVVQRGPGGGRQILATVRVQP